MGHVAAGEGADAVADADAGAGADGWEVAASSKGAARHRRRKAVKKQQHLDAFEEEWAEHTELVQQHQQEAQQQQQQQQEQQSPAVTLSDEQQEQADGQEAEDAGAADDGSRAAADASNDELLAEQHCIYTADDLDSTPQQQQQLGGPGSRGWQSSVAIITGDFAMQNVLLQMGLRLLTKDGRRIARLTRYALRCSACFAVTREPGRLFCPKCGNLSLDQVEVVVGADGAEYFGVTKRHILRGTRFSLPKPKVGACWLWGTSLGVGGGADSVVVAFTCVSPSLARCGPAVVQSQRQPWLEGGCGSQRATRSSTCRLVAGMWQECKAW